MSHLALAIVLSSAGLALLLLSIVVKMVGARKSASPLSMPESTLRRIQSEQREVKKGGGNRRWESFASSVVHLRGRCAACGGTEHLQSHHVVPPKLDPSLEHVRENVIVLCMGAPECHLRIGHGGDWDSYNPSVLVDAHESIRFPERRMAIATRALESRLKIL